MAEWTEPRRAGRARVTTKGAVADVALKLFIARGYADVTVDDIARGAGIGRRSFFRYFPSKPDVAWGDFDRLLDEFRERLQRPTEPSLVAAIWAAVRAFNDVPADERARHRHRMRLLLTTPELVAHSTTRYASWRDVIAGFVARRLGVPDGSPVPQAVSWACLGISLAAYERWLDDEDAELLPLIDESFEAFGAIFSGTLPPPPDGVP